ncbi:hypothetical protein GCM10009746_10820 [Microbacterium paludicola]
MPDPPPRPARVVAAPSAMSARPVCWFTELSVMVATPRTWPTFSATSTSTTGRNIAIADHVPPEAKSGRWNSGTPSQSASAIVSAGLMPVAGFTTSRAPRATATM